MKSEEQARKQIDQLLQAAGWEIQDLNDLNLGAGLGVAVENSDSQMERVTMRYL